MPEKFLMYGAGSVGRGFIGPLFANAGYEVVFVDINKQVIEAFNHRREYNVTVALNEPYNIPVSGVRGVDGRDELAVLEEIASCTLMATSLGAAALKNVAPLIAKGFMLRMSQGGPPLNLLICENLKDSSHLLRGWLADALEDGGRALLADNLGLIEAAIGRMIPVAAAVADPLQITVEEYGFLPVDRDAFVGEPPDVPGLIPYSPFPFYEERKLYLHNMGHAICAYLGIRQGCATIAEAIADPFIRLLTQCAMTESAEMLSIKYEHRFSDIFDHAEDLLLRFGNEALGDTCERVGRDPMRKLQTGDRLAGAMVQCRENGIHPVYIALGYAAALRAIEKDPREAAKIAMETGGLDNEQTELVVKLFASLELPMPELFSAAEKLKKELRGNIV